MLPCSQHAFENFATTVFHVSVHTKVNQYSTLAWQAGAFLDWTIQNRIVFSGPVSQLEPFTAKLPHLSSSPVAFPITLNRIKIVTSQWQNIFGWLRVRKSPPVSTAVTTVWVRLLFNQEFIRDFHLASQDHKIPIFSGLYNRPALTQRARLVN